MSGSSSKLVSAGGNGDLDWYSLWPVTHLRPFTVAQEAGSYSKGLMGGLRNSRPLPCMGESMNPDGLEREDECVEGYKSVLL